MIPRVKVKAAIECIQVLTDSYNLRDRIIKIGSDPKKTPIVTSSKSYPHSDRDIQQADPKSAI